MQSRRRKKILVSKTSQADGLQVNVDSKESEESGQLSDAMSNGKKGNVTITSVLA